jgi:hypothetical protein
MLIVLYCKCLEPTLVEVAIAGRVPVRVPALRVRQGQPADESGQVAIVLWGDEQVPVIGHHTISQEGHRMLFLRFTQDTLERLIVPRLVEYRPTAIGPVQHMIDQAAHSGTQGPAHGPSLTPPRRRASIFWTAGKNGFLTPSAFFTLRFFQLAEKGARASETPFISFFTPTEMLTLAREAGFREVRHVSAADLAQRYFADRTDGLRPPDNSEELLVATTTPHPT